MDAPGRHSLESRSPHLSLTPSSPRAARAMEAGRIRSTQSAPFVGGMWHIAAALTLDDGLPPAGCRTMGRGRRQRQGLLPPPLKVKSEGKMPASRDQTSSHQDCHQGQPA